MSGEHRPFRRTLLTAHCSRLYGSIGAERHADEIVRAHSVIVSPSRSSTGRVKG